MFHTVPVLNDADEIAAAPAGTVLQDYPVEETDCDVFAIGIGGFDVETADRAGVESMTAVIWQWHRDHGAELVANWGTMLQFVVGRPPTPGDQAWTLARQIQAVGGSLQDPVWCLAHVLPDCRRWFLHDRP